MTKVEYERLGLIDKVGFSRLQKILDQRISPAKVESRHTIWYVDEELHNYVKLDHINGADTVLVTVKRKSGSSRQEDTFKLPASKKSVIDKLLNTALEKTRYSSTQKRWEYIHGVIKITLKWTPDLRYHIEFENMIDPGNESEAEHSIQRLAKELDVQLLTAEEEDTLYKKAQKKRRPDPLDTT